MNTANINVSVITVRIRLDNEYFIIRMRFFIYMCECFNRLCIERTQGQIERAKFGVQ